jgi:DUF4097 and DUF4098 domain-containing protein YvlB
MFAVPALALIVASPGQVSARVTDRHTRTLALPADRALALSITIGEVRIEGGSRQDVHLDVIRHAPDAEALARVPLTVEESTGRVDIRAEQPDGGRDAALRTDMTLKVPAGAIIDPVRIAEGRLELSRLSGRIAGEVVRGSIEAQTIEGTVRLETGIGDVSLDAARLVPGGLLRLRTFNGDVQLRLAERPPDARILALALNGTIASDIPLTTKNTWGPRWGEARLGRGEPVISIDVVTGSIDIRSR